MRADQAATAFVPAARAFFVAASERPLFAWHHAPDPRLRRGAGVLLCPPLGYEYMSAYQAWRLLAERLAALGFDTVRLDYDGTGNSAGDDQDPDRFGAWVRSIDAAITETRSLSGSSHLAPVGLRIGALLALQAAAGRGGVERLVLWSPVRSGRSYVRELKVVAGLTREDYAREDPEGPGLNAVGYVMTGDTVKALEQWTLDVVKGAPAPQVLVVDRDDRSVDPQLDAYLETLGSRVTRVRPKGTAEMLQEPQLSKVPEPALDAITAWLSGWRVPPPIAPAVAIARPEAVGTGRDAYREPTVRFGPGDRLFGVLTEPADGSRDLPAIILLNTGVEYLVGPHRLYVPLARQWAARGHLVLRYDLGGLGDSAPPAGAALNVAYPEHMLEDAGEAIAFVRRKAPRRQVILAGLCSGGWLAFQAARAGLPVDGIVSINPPMYLVELAAGMHWHERKRSRQSIRNPSKWLKAFYRGVPYATFRRVAASVLGRERPGPIESPPGDARPSRLATDLQSIAERGIRSLFVFSSDDNGLSYFQLHAQPALLPTGRRGLIRHVVVAGAGHSFRPRAAQLALRQILIDFMAADDSGRA
jgi:alpha-beta hydrolase superfamily lysophospholipase